MPYYFRLLPVIQSYTVLVCFIGLFGNFSLILATCRHKSLRNKMGCLLMISTISHTVCLVSELVSVVLKLRFTHLYRDECFQFVVVYTFAVLFQSTLFLMMALDLLLAVIMPIRHKFWHRWPYLLLLCLPPLAFSLIGILVEKAYVNHEYLLFCTVSLAVPNTVRFWGTIITFSTVLLAVVLISVTALRVHLNQQKKHSSIVSVKAKSSEIKLLKSLATLIFVFICSWSLSLVLFHVSLYLDMGTRYQVHKYTFLLQLPTFCQNFFVTALRSPRYRRAYFEQWRWLTCSSFSAHRISTYGFQHVKNWFWSTGALKKFFHPVVHVRRFNSLPPVFL